MPLWLAARRRGACSSSTLLAAAGAVGLDCVTSARQCVKAQGPGESTCRRIVCEAGGQEAKTGRKKKTGGAPPLQQPDTAGLGREFDEDTLRARRQLRRLPAPCPPSPAARRRAAPAGSPLAGAPHAPATAFACSAYNGERGRSEESGQLQAEQFTGHRSGNSAASAPEEERARRRTAAQRVGPAPAAARVSRTSRMQPNAVTAAAPLQRLRRRWGWGVGGRKEVRIRMQAKMEGRRAAAPARTTPPLAGFSPPV